MKRIFLVLCYVTTSVVMVSCTNDDVETTQKIQKQQVSADGDGQSGQIPIKPPK